MEEVSELFRAKRISGAPVVKDEKLVGVLSIEDLIRCLREYDLQSPVSKYMSRNVISVKEFDPVIEALENLCSQQYWTFARVWISITNWLESSLKAT